MEERPTRRVYIEILTCTTIIQHLEESRSHGNKAEAEWGLAQGAHPPVVPNQGPLRRVCPTDSKDRGKSRDYGRFDRMVENNMTWIDDVEIPWGLLFLDFLGATLPRFLGGYYS